MQHLLVVALVTAATGVLSSSSVWAQDQAIRAGLASDWQGAEMAKSRLIVAHAPHHHGRKLLAGLQFKLDAGWFTYWRTPGETGAPPEFDWSASRNIKDVKVLWPRPERVKVNDYTINGYPSGVVLPLLITPEDASEPMVLRVKVTFAVCRDVCVPVTTKHELQLEAIESAAERAWEAREREREAAREARERAREVEREAGQRARELERERRQLAREQAREGRQKVAEASALSREQRESIRERVSEALEAAREKAKEFFKEARKRAERMHDRSASARALEEKATRLAEAAEQHARAIERRANELALAHAQVIHQDAGMAERRAKVLEQRAEDLAEAAEDLAEAYADLIAHYVDMVPDGGEIEKKIRAAMGAVSETGSQRAIEVKILSDAPLKSPQVFVEAEGKVIFGTVEAKLEDDGRTVHVIAPISRANGTIDGHWVTVTIVDGTTAIERRVRIARRDVVTLPWPAASAQSPAQSGEATPPLAALPE